MTLESKVTEFVVDKTREYGLPEFNPLDRSELEQAAVQVLERSVVKPDDFGGSCSFVSVHTLEGDEPPGVVVKRMVKRPEPEFRGWKEKLWYSGEDSPDAVFAFLEEEHRTVERYFGREYVPDTLFLKINSNMGDYNPKMFEEGIDWVMLQEFIPGDDILSVAYEVLELPEELVQKVREPLLGFIERYKGMQREARLMIEDQLMLDVVTGELKIYDTNYLTGFYQLSKNPYFLHLTDQDPQTLTTEDLLRLIQHDPWLKGVFDFDLGSLESFPRDYFNPASRPVYRAGGKPLGKGFERLVGLTQDFPAYNGDNWFISELRKKFGLPPD